MLFQPTVSIDSEVMSCVSCCAADTLDMQFIDNIRGGLVQNNAARSFQTFKKNQNRKRSGLGEIVLIEPCGLFAVNHESWEYRRGSHVSDQTLGHLISDCCTLINTCWTCNSRTQKMITVVWQSD